MKRFSILVFGLFCFPTAILAQPVGDAGGYLKPVSIAQLEQQIKDNLKSAISIVDYRPQASSSDTATATSETTITRRGGAPRPVMAMPVMRSRGAQVSGTNLQEQGVDEADMVKTDGRYLYGVNQQAAGIRIFDTQAVNGSGAVQQIATAGLAKGMQLQGIYLVPNKKQLIAIASSYKAMPHHGLRPRHPSYYGSPHTHIIIFNIENAAKPVLVRQINFEGSYYQTRRINNRLYLVLNHNISLNNPVVYKAIESKRPLTDAEKELEKKKIITAVDGWSLKDNLPSYTELNNQKQLPLFSDNKVYLTKNSQDIYSFASLVTLNLDDIKQEPQATAFQGMANQFYMSDKAAYFISPIYESNFKVQAPISSMNTNLLHKFSVQGNAVTYRGSGVFFGELGWNELSTFQFDEDARGNLRVVTYNGAQTAKHPDPVTRSPVILTVLAEHPSHKQLVTAARLPNATYPKPLGKPGERLYGARLFNDYAYFVTFRNTDPLYVVDLRDARNPKVAGELVIPGFSDYLHPITSTLLLGVGKAADAATGGATQGWKLSLFDIANPARPQEVDKIELGGMGSDSPANRNHHAITSLAINNNTLTRVALPVNVVEKDSGQMKNGLHRFEVQHAKRKLQHLGAFAAGSTQSWNWNDDERSILIDNKLYYFRNGNFYATNWSAN